MGVKVSVIMAAYNCENMVRESIESIVQQTFLDWQLIICDDGSSDNTFRILKEYEHKYPEKMRVIKNKVNSKLPFSLNRCLQYATGEYVARMDADDKSYPERLEKQVNYLNTHPEVDVVGTAMTCFDGDKITGMRYPMKNPNPSIIGSSVPFFHATIMMRKSVYDALGGYSLEKTVLRCEDVDLWMRFFGEGYKGENLQEALYYVREDGAAVGRRQFKYALNASKTLLRGYKKYHYPLGQYVWVLKPIISAIVPKNVKYLFNRKRWNRR